MADESRISEEPFDLAASLAELPLPSECRLRRWDFLMYLIKLNDYKVIAEVGVDTGLSARPIATSCKLDQYFLVDPRVDEKLYRDLISAPVSFMKMTSLKASSLIQDGCLDLVFIDVDPHSYEECSEDIKLWLPKVRKGGVISGDDYGPGFPGIIQAVNESFDSFNLEVDAAAPSKCVWWRVI